MSLLEKAIAAGVLALVAVGGWWKLTAHYDAKGFARAQAEGRAVAEAQVERNHELMRRAELRYTVQADVRDRFIVTTIKEIEHAAAPLATCPVPEPVRLRLNAIAACAREDTPAACGADAQVPDAR